MKRPFSPRKGFTLIELLVVIAIITVLASILFPVFGRVRETARRSACLSNAKNIGLAMMQYSQDFDERFPINRYLADTGEPGYPGYKTWDDAVYPYLKSNQVYICPNAYFENTRTFSMNLFVAGWTNYFSGSGATSCTGSDVGNGGYATFGVPNACYRKTASEIPLASNTVLLMEAFVPQPLAPTACSGVPSDCYNRRGQYISSGITGNAHATTKPWGDYTGHIRNPAGGFTYGAGTGVHINDTYNVIYCDGHAKPIGAGQPPTDKTFLWYPAS